MQTEILRILKEGPTPADELVKKVQAKCPEASTSDIKFAISPLLSVGKIEFTSENKLQRGKVLVPAGA